MKQLCEIQSERQKLTGTVISLTVLLSAFYPPNAIAEDGYRIVAPQKNDVLITSELQDTDLRSALKLLAYVENANIAFQRDVSGNVHSLLVSGVPAQKVFELLLRMHNLYAEQVGNVVIVYPIEQYIRETRGRKLLHDE